MAAKEKKETKKEAEKRSSSIKQKLIFAGVIIILAFAIITFVFLPVIGVSSGSRGELVFGKWGKTPVKYTQDSFFAYQISRIASEGLQLNEYSRRQLWHNAYLVSLQRIAMADEVLNAGYKTPESILNESLLSYYSDASGKFSSKIYNSVSAADRARVKKLCEEDLLVQIYARDMLGAIDETQDALYGLKTASGEISALKEVNQKRRRFYAAVFAIGEYPQELLEEYAAANAEKFTVFDLSVVTAQTEAEAQRLLSRIENQEITFDDAASEYSSGAYSGADGAFSYTYRYQLERVLSDEAIDDLIAAPEGALSAVIPIGGQFGFFRVDSAAKSADLSDESLAQTVFSYMRSYERGAIEDYSVALAGEFASLAAARGFEEACAAEAVELLDIPFFCLNYGGVELFPQLPVSSVPQLYGAERSENFLRTAFSLNIGGISEPIVVGDSVFVISPIEEESPSDADFEADYEKTARGFGDGEIANFIIGSEKHDYMFFETYEKIYPSA